MSDAGERTQEATPRRKARARAQGQVVRSAFAGPALALILAFIPAIAAVHGLGFWMLGLASAAHAAAQSARDPDAGSLISGAAATVLQSHVMSIVAAAWFASASAALAASVLCGSLHFAPGALAPSLQRVSWSTCARRLCAPDNTLQACGAALVFLLTALALIPSAVQALREVGSPSDFLTQVALGAAAIVRMWWHIAVALTVVAVVEIALQRRRHAARIRMTPRELRDERTQTEAKPELKQRRKAVAAKRARGLRIGAIRRATVVIVNPTHVALALRYAPPQLDVPTIVARGADLAAGIIRSTAQLYDIPVVSAPELARTLFAAADVDEPIPEEFYAAVAAVFAWIVRTRGVLRRGDESSP